MTGRPVTFHSGARIEWCGWRTSPIQDLAVGWWIATRRGVVAAVSTTCGGIETVPVDADGRAAAFRTFDLTVTDDERRHDHRQESESARRRALERLRQWLDAHREWERGA